MDDENYTDQFSEKEDDDKKLTIIEFIIDYIENTIEETNTTPEQLANSEFVKQFFSRFSNTFNFEILASVDKYFFKNFGIYWRPAYKYPKKYDEIYISEKICGPHSLSTENDIRHKAIVTKSYFFTMDVQKV